MLPRRTSPTSDSLSLSHSLHESRSALGAEEELEGDEKEEEEKRLKRLWIWLWQFAGLLSVIGTWVIVKMKLTVLTADERIVSLDVEPDELVSLPSNPSSFS
jgi:hypothetical protein